MSTTIIRSTWFASFEMTKNSLVEKTIYPYRMGRKAVRNAMLKKTDVSFRFHYSTDGSQDYGIGFRTKSSLRLGCQKFVGNNYLKLRRWALAARRKS